MTAQLPGAAELGDEEAGLAGEIGATFDHVAVAGRRIAGKEATITAAGATVAVIGTAAIVRRARRHRRIDP